MTDTGFVIPAEKAGRHAKALPINPETGQPQSGRSFTEPPKFACGGGCAVSTAGDYLRFVHMLLNKGSYGATRILGRKTVEYMLSDQLGTEIKNQVATASSVHVDYGHGLGLTVRTTLGLVRNAGSVCEFSWVGASGTFFWGDPREELGVVWMASIPGGAVRRDAWRRINALVNQAIAD